MPDLISSRPVVKRPSRWGRWFRVIEFAVQLTVAVLYVLYAIRYYQITTRLNEALAEMDRTDPGWRLQDIEAARAVVPDDENSALTILAASKSLPKDWTQDGLLEELGKLPPERQMTPDQYGRLSQKLDSVRGALAELRRLEHMQRGRLPLVYPRNPESNSFPGIQETREAAALLRYDAIARAQAGDLHGAVFSTRAAANAGRSIGDEPAGSAQLVRAADAGFACSAIQRIVAQSEPDEADLKSVQELLEQEDAHPYWQITCRGERAIDNDFLEALESGDLKMSELLDAQSDWEDRLFPFFREDYVRTCHPQLFTYLDRMEAAGEMPAYLRTPTLHQIDLDIAKSWANLATVRLLSMPLLMESFDRRHAILRSFTVGLAAERYRRAHGDWPQSLTQLTPDWLAVVPTDPYTGDPLLYRRLPDGVIVYSVGKDGKDDGGNVDAVNVSEPGTDLGIRLWNVASRRQPPLPPAAPR